jgi:universal stress protein A
VTFRHVLVAVDGSAHAHLALEAAVSVARRDHAKLTLLAVAPDVSAVAATAAPTLAHDIEVEARGHIEAALAEIPDDVGVTTLLRHGKPGPRICEEAAAGAYDGIFLGARGVGRVGAVIGSVSGHVLHHATTAVFVAHRGQTP